MWRYVLAGAFLVWVARCEQAKSAKPIVRNPRRRRNPNGLNAADKQTLAEAERIAGEFHGEAGARQVIELSESERLLPRFVVATGPLKEFTYEPNRGSDRASWRWVHETGDRGPLQERLPYSPILCAHPITLKPIVVPLKSSLKLDPQRGWVG